MGDPIEVDSGLTREYAISNHSDLSDDVVRNAPEVKGLMRELARWAENVRRTSMNPMFDRQAFTPPNNVYDEMRAARTAVETDDIVSGVADITESFALQGMKLEGTDADLADVFNQWAAKVDMDSVFRRWWREEYTLSQCVMAMVWEEQTYKPRGLSQPSEKQQDDHEQEVLGQIGDQQAGVPTLPDKPKPPKGRKRRKEYKLWMPSKIAILDATKIVPVGTTPLGPELLCWHATKAEIGQWYAMQNGEVYDPVMDSFYVGHYKPTADEKVRLGRMGIASDQLLLLNPDLVFRHTATKPDYEAFPTLRMKSIFPQLDLKRQLIAADRASLIGAANYILLVKKGTDQQPGKQEEVDNLKENYNFLAKLPVIISDHRLNIEIIAPKVDLTLNPDKYNVLDQRLLMRLLGNLSIGGAQRTADNADTLSHALARSMENKRHMMKRTIERVVINAVCDDPRNKHEKLDDKPSLVFLPRQIQLGFDPTLTQALLSLRTQREISRETILESFSLDQATEALRMEQEEDTYDAIFKTQIPFAAPGAGGAPGGGVNTGDPTANGRQGGRPSGGGSPSADATKAKPKSKKGNTSTKAAGDE